MENTEIVLENTVNNEVINQGATFLGFLGIGGLVILGIIALVIIWVILIYNTLIRKRIRAEEGWADVDVQLKRRYDLVPNLVKTVKGYAKHESETLVKVMDARAKATAINIDASNVTMEQMAAFSGAQSGLSGTLGKLFAVAEDYPDLKANENFLKLQEELADVEDKIQAARRFFNNTVQEYNTQIEIFPSSIVAKTFSFKQKEFFELAESDPAKKNIDVKF